MSSARVSDEACAGNTEQEAFDLIVVGAGVGGMTAALVGAISGQRTLLIEKSAQVGGTSATSSGTVWIPDNPYQRSAGITEDAERALTYLDALVDDRADRELRATFIAAGPEMLTYLESHTDIRFRPYPNQADYRQDQPGAASGWRALEPLPFDGRTLGTHFDEVRWPLRELMLFGGMMVTRGEVAQLLKIGRSWQSMWLALRLGLRYVTDRLRYKRGTRLVIGNALVARLYKNLLDRQVVVRLHCTPLRPIITNGRVTGLDLRHHGVETRVVVRNGVVLAGGGFPANAAWRERYLPSPVAQYTAAFEGCTGETLQLGQQAGAALGAPGEDNALWFPSSIARRKDGSTAVYPHIVLDRGKPGLIAVNQAGKRFVNEAVSYHEFTRAMYRAHRQVPSIPTMLVCDRRFVWKYGLGMIRPLTLFLRPYIASGYLHVADSVAELAHTIGVDPDGLVETVRTYNTYARTGVDLEFDKGRNIFDRGSGDPTHTPNPCIGPINAPPYCAVAVVPTPLGTSLGLRADIHAQVLDRDGHPVQGLYVCGNDMHSPMGGEYPGAGSQLGAAMTFGYLAARHAAQYSIS